MADVRRYLTPIKDSDGTSLAVTSDGIYTLVANNLYYFVLGNTTSPFQSVQITGYDATLVITSATLQDTNHGGAEVSDSSHTAGEWLSETPTTTYVSSTGSGWSVGTTGIGASTGAALGGILWHVAETGAARTRLAVQVGATGGRLRVSSNGRDRTV